MLRTLRTFPHASFALSFVGGIGEALSAKVKETTQMRNGENEQSCPVLDNFQYRCRACGEPLPPGSRALFHPACLKEDKRHRTQEKRRLEKERILGLLCKIRCRHCGNIPVLDESSQPTRSPKKRPVKLHDGLSGAHS